MIKKITKHGAYTRHKLILFSLVMLLIACDSDIQKTDHEVDASFVYINDSSFFCGEQFLLSYNKIFSNWKLENDHVIDENGKMTESNRSYTIYGSIGKNIATTNHYYNVNGIITNSETLNVERETTTSSKYKYDHIGRIIEIIGYNEYTDGSSTSEDTMMYSYNSAGNIERMVLRSTSLSLDSMAYRYKYDSNNRVIESITEGFFFPDNWYNEETTTFYTYLDGQLAQAGNMSYEYDAMQRLVKLSSHHSTADFTTITYSDSAMTMWYYRDSVISVSATYLSGKKQSNYRIYTWEEDLSLKYCYEKLYNESRNNCYSGSIEQLLLCGYSIKEYNDNKKVKETFYSSDGQMLYFIIFIYDRYGYIDEDGSFLYTANGMEVDWSSLNEDLIWINHLAFMYY